MIDDNGSSITDQQQISNHFNTYFSNISENILNERKFTGDGNFEKYLQNPVKDRIYIDPVYEDEIKSIILNINIHKSCGPTSIPTNILKYLVNDIASPLSLIINLALTSGVHPDKLKIAKVIPIFKKGSKLKTCNYRPISLLSNLNKMFEKIVFSRVYGFLEKNYIIYKNQYGFRAKHSTEHTLINLTEKIRNVLDTKSNSPNKICMGCLCRFPKGI